MSIRVQDLMTESVVTVKANDDLSTAYDLMDERRIRHLPVLEEGTLCGLITERDLLRGALGEASGLPISAQRELLRSVRVDSVMVSEPITVERDTPIREAGELLIEHKLGCVPVLSGDELVGILTESDFVRYTLEQL